MPFKFQIGEVSYEGHGEDAATVLHGAVVEGELSGPESICVQTRSGTTYRFWIDSMEVGGPDMLPLTPGHKSQVSLGVGGHPPERDIVVPSVAVADGHR